MLNRVSVFIEAPTYVVDANAYRSLLDEFSCTVRHNEGLMALYMPQELMKELLSLNSEILNLSESISLKVIDLNNPVLLKESDAWKTVIHAKKILGALRKEITTT